MLPIVVTKNLRAVVFLAGYPWKCFHWAIPVFSHATRLLSIIPVKHSSQTHFQLQFIRLLAADPKN